ncbi:hypothetical protein KUTeg_020382 [Tegillarca granosa]|uniref:Guanylate cyclase domain-containing protein n=1 Tax=Tegillarca granosa TaxID=220873 RepID=A0ABQ9ED60_TEGGR|nr:hypothetical protein KUTeg_020382 [Tegillarca granosa]
MKKRGSVTVKGKGEMKTYWLQGKTFEMSSAESNTDLDQQGEKQEVPGEIAGYEEPTYRFALNFPLPGRMQGASNVVPREGSAESLRTAARIMAVAPSVKSLDGEAQAETQRLFSDKDEI